MSHIYPYPSGRLNPTCCVGKTILGGISLVIRQVVNIMMLISATNKH